MKPIIKDIAAAAFMGLVLPWVMLGVAVSMEPRQVETTEIVLETAGDTSPQSELAMYLRLPDGTLEEREMDDYLVGVVCAEMPASFSSEALKAQSVVARTFALKAFVTGGKHGDGSVCTDPNCCQAYLTQEEFYNCGGNRESLNKIRAAVQETSGLVLTYEENLIEATYFSCSGGSTEDAVAVWGTDFPYLRAVVSPGEEKAAHFTDTVRFTRGELEKALGVRLSGTGNSWLGFTTYTSGGGVNTMVIGGTEFSGTQLRKLLNLRSTAFSVQLDGDGVVITTKGFGHRVGMSQYGADAMAAGGSSFREILAYYYNGTTLTQWQEN